MPTRPIRSPGPTRHVTSPSSVRRRPSYVVVFQLQHGLARAAASRTPSVRRSRAAAARPRSAPRPPRCGSAASTSAPADRGAATPAPCAPGSAASPRPSRPAGPARRARTSSRRNHLRTARRGRSRPPTSALATVSRNHRSCVTTTTAIRRASRWSASHCTPSTSRWLVGSSSTTQVELPASAAASETRRRSPPERFAVGVSSPIAVMPSPSTMDRTRASAAHSCSAPSERSSTTCRRCSVRQLGPLGDDGHPQVPPTG